jgi:carbonic anhydrase/acetyltransferase-like protein (isoleucine patch superfamily)
MMKRYEKRSVIAGIPADFKKEAKESDLKMWRAGAKTWKDLALRYKKAGLKI